MSTGISDVNSLTSNFLTKEKYLLIKLPILLTRSDFIQVTKSFKLKLLSCVSGLILIK